MKYKLINTETKEEHLCDEVITKDGTKAYVTNECPTIGEYAYDRGEIIKKTTTSDLSNYQQKVIATNNPNMKPSVFLQNYFKVKLPNGELATPTISKEDLLVLDKAFELNVSPYAISRGRRGIRFIINQIVEEELKTTK